MGYSIACHELLSYDNLIKHLYYIQAQPEAIPYRTSYYTKRWGFCLSYNQFLSLNPKEQYEVFIDSCHNEEGSMTVAEAVIEGESKEEIVFSSYICHPSLANNELSGPLVLCYLYLSLIHISEPTRQAEISYAVFCLKKKKQKTNSCLLYTNTK